MTTSNYFNNFNSRPEQLLYEDLIGEVVKIYGIDSYYLPRSSASSLDLLFGDDPTKKFESTYPIEVYIENVDSFDGQELFSKFGLEIRKEINFIMPFRAFKKSVPTAEATRPREGDLLWLKNFKALFEIKFVNEQHFFYTFGKNDFYGFKLSCELFRYNNEQFETGFIDIDDTKLEKGFAYQYIVDEVGVGTYSRGEIVYRGDSLETATATAQVSSWNITNSNLILTNIKGVFNVGDFIVGNDSNASYRLESYKSMDDVNSNTDDNVLIQNEADEILDWSESNPFGQV
jgi:hypothetical protein